MSKDYLAHIFDNCIIYTKTHKYISNSQQADQENVALPVNVTVAAYTWIRQAGFPVIKLSVRTDRTTVDVTQRLYLETPDRPLVEYYPSPYRSIIEYNFSIRFYTI